MAAFLGLLIAIAGLVIAYLSLNKASTANRLSVSSQAKADESAKRARIEREKQAKEREKQEEIDVLFNHVKSLMAARDYKMQKLSNPLEVMLNSATIKAEIKEIDRKVAKLTKQLADKGCTVGFVPK